ncbi:hypothetical protein ACJRO7_001716 [Eucalyptus globulus]|uniref:Gnk2-homologous domain-containing protein n=1 Tax=Eucalyptus globulus TaxID=34317 RepID=A0ABD3LRX6_EUCGL
MSSARSALTLLFSALLLLLLLLRAALGADRLFHFCSTSENFTAGSPFKSNLNKLTSFLYTKTPSSGFSLGSGDTSPSDCKACVADAGTEIRQRCPRNKRAIIWYDNCMFKYLDTDLSGQIDNANKFYMRNLNNLVEEAYTVPKLYATREMGLEDKMKLYGLVQCTRDLSAIECKECLEGAIGKLPSYCNGKEGGRVVGGSCNFRYEIYPFVNL